MKIDEKFNERNIILIYRNFLNFVRSLTNSINFLNIGLLSKFKKNNFIFNKTFYWNISMSENDLFV